MLKARPSLPELAGEFWDLIVVGGGITGAGVCLQAALLGKKVLLVEQRDFAWGTSSRSSKMVHGGLRYLAQGDVRLTRAALRERERLLRELPGLVERGNWLFPLHKGHSPRRLPLTLALRLYDFLAGIRDHRYLSRSELLQRVPGLAGKGLRGAMGYTDALTDDSRLVMRTLLEACRSGATTLNYTAVTVAQGEADHMRVTVVDQDDGTTAVLETTSVINATGAWAEHLAGGGKSIRPLRGSHLFIRPDRLPIRDCLMVVHPGDGRPVFIYPWQGVTCVGTTDLDHEDDLNTEASATAAEVDYLLEVVDSQFPEAHLQPQDILATQAGVRPVIASGRGRNPSGERRDHAVWQGGSGVVTASGGKLTTFRLIALDALRAAGLLDKRSWRRARRSNVRLFRPLDGAPTAIDHFLHTDQKDEALLRWCLEHEDVVHLDDLLLRRTRLGLICADGGASLAPTLERLVAEVLGWDEVRWKQEWQRYQAIRKRYYGIPPGSRLATP